MSESTSTVVPEEDPVTPTATDPPATGSGVGQRVGGATPRSGARQNERRHSDDGTVHLTTTEALARIPIGQLRVDRANGLRTAAFVSGHQDPPLGRLDDELVLARGLAADLPLVLRPAVDADQAATAVMGSQLVNGRPDAGYDGVLGIWYGAGPGLDRAAGAMRHANFVGTNRFGGVVALVGDDPAATASTVPSPSDVRLIDLKMPLLCPGDVQDVLDLGRHAVALSRLSGLWTAMKIEAAVAGGAGSTDPALDRVRPIVPDLVVDGDEYVAAADRSLVASGDNRCQQQMDEVRLLIARRYGVVNDLNLVTADPRRPWIGLVAAGFTYGELLEALRRLGFGSPADLEDAGIRLLRLAMPYPLDTRVVTNFARGLSELVVIEEQSAVIEWMIKDALYGAPNRPVVVGRTDESGATLFPAQGLLTADRLLPVVRGRLEGRLADRLAPAPGPRREQGRIAFGSLDVGAAVAGAGTEGSQWIGMEPFVEQGHLVQDLGHGSFFQTAQPAIRFAIAAGAHMTFNLPIGGRGSATDGQDPSGVADVRDLASVLLIQGVTEVLIITDDLSIYKPLDLPTARYAGKTKVWDRIRIVEAKRYLATVPGVTVLIDDLSRPGGDGLGSTVRGAADRSSGKAGTGVAGSRRSLPHSKPSTGPDRVGIRLAGTDRTGVVTVSRILGAAAVLDGWRVRGTDQTGRSATAGPLISDLWLTRDEPSPTGLLGLSEADVIVAFDPLVAATERVLSCGDPRRTVLIGSSTVTPTVETVRSPDRRGPSIADLTERLALASDRESSLLVDAEAMTRGLFGDGASVNFFLLGIAVQSGAIPIDPGAVCQAMEFNGNLTDTDNLAFRCGRQWTIDPRSVPPAAETDRGASAATPGGMVVGPLPPSLAEKLTDLAVDDDGLRSLLELLAADLVAYQDEAYAGAFLDFLTKTVGVERYVDRRSTDLGHAVARGLHRLMACEDEYETARLAKRRSPLLESAGSTRRRGGVIGPLLARGRRLRRTAIDPFGRSELRRAERSLPAEYIGALTRAYDELTIRTLPSTIELARSALDVHGSGNAKKRRIADFRCRLAAATDAGGR